MALQNLHPRFKSGRRLQISKTIRLSRDPLASVVIHGAGSCPPRHATVTIGRGVQFVAASLRSVSLITPSLSPATSALLVSQQFT
jgi:hypothetical protein